MQPQEGTFFQRQILPVSLTLVICAALTAILYIQILVLNRFTEDDILLQLRWGDVLIGLTVYLKTSVDFAIFIGNLMHANSGWKNRISIEFGTALGNALGTMIILAVWVLFKEVDWLLALMIIVAGFVLIKLAEDGLEHAMHSDREYPRFFKRMVRVTELTLQNINKTTRPVLKRILPEMSMKAEPRNGFFALLAFSFMVPFILGLDDFAGYVPLFSVINIFGFAVGVFIAHAVLNMFLFLSPERTIKIVKNPIISFVGSLAFVGIAVWGFYEAYHIIAHAYLG